MQEKKEIILKERKEKTKKEKAREKKPERKISKKKIAQLEELLGLIRKNNTVMITSIEGIPSQQFQLIRKNLRKDVIISVVKKKMAQRAIEEAGKEKKEIKKLAQYTEGIFAILFSQLDPFKLASILAGSRTKAKAKAGQVAPEDIKLEAEVTDIPAGPMITQLGNAGVKVGVEEGKISIKEEKIIVKKEEKISADVADILSKLGITPFVIGLEPIAAYSEKDKKIYAEIKIDKEKTKEKLKEASAKTLSLAEKICYYCKKTIKGLLRKAFLNASAFKKKETEGKAEEKEEKKEAERPEEKAEEKEPEGKEKPVEKQEQDK